MSPDGERIAVGILGKIFLVPIGGGRAERVGSGPGWDTDPAWSADGPFLACSHRLPRETYLVMLDLASGTTRFVHRTEAAIGPIAFHPNGRELFFVLDRSQYDAHVWRVPLAGGDAEPITRTENWHEWSFALSPDGDRLFLESGRYGGADLYELASGDTIEATRLTRTPNRNELAVEWAADGRRVYIRQENGVDRLMVRPAGGGEPREVFRSPYSEKALDLTPDGSAAVIADARRLVRVDLATGESAAIPSSAEFTVADREPGDLVVTNARVFTGIRDPGVSVAMSMNFKDANAMGLPPGPRIFSAGPLIDGPGGYHPAVDVALDDPAAAEPLVRALHAQGVDALKVYFQLDPDGAAAVVDAAHEVGIPVTGHIGVRTSWGEAMDAGIDGFNHIRVWKDFLPPEMQADGRNESLDGRKFPMRRMQADWTLIDPDGPEVGRLIERMVETGVAMDPTLRIQRPGDRDAERFGIEEFQIVRDAYEKMERFVVRAQEAGVPILAGTDNIGLIDELEAYQDAGMARAEIVRAATVDGAHRLGREDDFGTVEAGKRADLILVDGDPLQDVGDLREVRYVIQYGRVVVRR